MIHPNPQDQVPAGARQGYHRVLEAFPDRAERSFRDRAETMTEPAVNSSETLLLTIPIRATRQRSVAASSESENADRFKSRVNSSMRNTPLKPALSVIWPLGEITLGSTSESSTSDLYRRPSFHTRGEWCHCEIACVSKEEKQMFFRSLIHAMRTR
jgi:hypothetical protein